MTNQEAADKSREIGQKLKEIRNAQGLTQPELAAKLGIDFETVSKMESRKFNFGIDSLVKWANALGYEVGLFEKN